MKKRLCSVLLALVMALTLLPMAAFADSGIDNAPGIGDGDTTGTTPATPTRIESSTTTLNTGSYTLENDVTLTSGLTVAQGAEVSIDLGNHTITGSNSTVPLTINGGKVTITGPGSILVTKANSEAIDVLAANSELTINGAITLGPSESVAGTYTILLGKNSSGSKVNITGATITGRVGIYVNGNTADGADGRGTDAPVINLNQVTVNATSRGLMLNGNANTTVDGGSISGNGDGDNVGAEIRAGSLTVKGGAAIVGGNGNPTSEANGNGSTSANAGIAVAQHTTVKPITVNVKDGATVSGGAALYVTNPQGNTTEDIDQTVTVSGAGTTLTSTHVTDGAKGDAVFAQAPVNIVIKAGATLDGNVTMTTDAQNSGKGSVNITGATVNGNITNDSGNAAAVTVDQSTVTGTIDNNVTVIPELPPIPVSPSYTVSAPASANGSVRLDKTSAREGGTVTLTATPDEGYQVKVVTVRTAKGDSVDFTDLGDGKYSFTMPASAVIVEVRFAAMAEPVSFTDVPADAYYADAVAWAVEKGITAGTGETTFSPNATCTRAQTVTFLWRAAGAPAPKSAENPFADVSADAYYYEAVLWAVENGVTNGTSATTFSPEDTVTRAQTVTFMYRAAGAQSAAGSNSFADVDAEAYYADAVQWAVDHGVTAGTGATTFAPADGCVRAQIVTFLYRYHA